MRIIKEGKVLGEKIHLADSFWLRLKGLLGKKALERGSGLLLRPCRQVHTWFMAFPLDIIFLDKEGQIVELIRGLGPGQVSPLVVRSQQVLEMPVGTIEAPF